MLSYKKRAKNKIICNKVGVVSIEDKKHEMHLRWFEHIHARKVNRIEKV